MPLNKSHGNMYSWVTHTHNHLGGECPHKCSYCSTKVMAKRFNIEKYKGPIRLIEKELTVGYGTGKTIFIENCGDLFAEQVPLYYIQKILKHCREYSGNTYVYQTKNPDRYADFLGDFPVMSLFGTTIESNWESNSRAPKPKDRMIAMAKLQERCKFVTIEPIIDFDVATMVIWIRQIRPLFVNIGADSKGIDLPEPAANKIKALIDGIGKAGIEIRCKRNVERLLK